MLIPKLELTVWSASLQHDTENVELTPLDPRQNQEVFFRLSLFLISTDEGLTKLNKTHKHTKAQPNHPVVPGAALWPSRFTQLERMFLDLIDPTWQTLNHVTEACEHKISNTSALYHLRASGLFKWQKNWSLRAILMKLKTKTSVCYVMPLIKASLSFLSSRSWQERYI